MKGVVIRKILFFATMLIFFSPLFLAAQEWTYTLRPGDNLWTLSERYLSSMRYWRKLQDLNQISDPKNLQPGTRLKIPIAWLKIQPAPVRVVAVSGKVFFRSKERGENKALAVGKLLQVEDSVRTGANGSVSFVFADGSRLLLQANSFLVFDQVQIFGETGMVDSRVRLKKGRLRTTVNPDDRPGMRFEIHSPGAITAVRGTELRVTGDTARGISSTEVLKGRVDVIAAGVVQSVSAGFGTWVKVGEPPSAPKMLLQAPNLKGLPARVTQLPLRFIWPNLVGASSYRIQMSKNEAFDVLLFDDIREKAELLLSDLPNGSYVMRIRGRDVLTLEGFNAVHAFVLEVPSIPPQKVVLSRPPEPVVLVVSRPPLLLRPPSDDVLDIETPEFEWEDVSKANLYHFQVADRADFLSPLIDISDFSKLKISTQPLKPGVYFWRVAAAGSSGKYGLFSPYQTFKIRNKPSQLTLMATDFEDKQLQIQWQGGKANEQYQVELSRNEGFHPLFFQKELAGTGLTLDRPEAGLYYLRVRAITPEGVAGEYTSPQFIEVPSEFCWSLFLLSVAALLAL